MSMRYRAQVVLLCLSGCGLLALVWQVYVYCSRVGVGVGFAFIFALSILVLLSLLIAALFSGFWSPPCLWLDYARWRQEQRELWRRRFIEMSALFCIGWCWVSYTLLLLTAITALCVYGFGALIGEEMVEEEEREK